MSWQYYIRLIIVSLCAIFFCLNSEVFEILYPTLESDYDVFLKYYASKNIAFEIAFSLFFLCIFLNSYKWVRAVAIFGFVMTFGSIVDKLIFGINDYIITDVILLIFATRLAWMAKKVNDPQNGQT